MESELLPCPACGCAGRMKHPDKAPIAPHDWIICTNPKDGGCSFTAMRSDWNRRTPSPRTDSPEDERLLAELEPAIDTLKRFSDGTSNWALGYVRQLHERLRALLSRQTDRAGLVEVARRAILHSSGCHQNADAGEGAAKMIAERIVTEYLKEHTTNG